MKLEIIQTSFGGKVILDFDASEIAQKTETRPILFIIDYSGSMAGSSFTMLKQAIRPHLSMLTKFAPIVFFNHDTVCVSTLDAFDKISATGGTSFSQAFNTSLKLLNQNIKGFQNVDVLFLTDGQCEKNNAADTNFQNAISKLKGHIHVIGYGQSHDLTRMMSIVGPTHLQNTYQYCRNANEIEKTIMNVISFNSAITLKLTQQIESFKDVTFVPLLDAPGRAQAQLILSKPLSPDVVIKFTDGTSAVVANQEASIADKIAILTDQLEGVNSPEMISMMQTEIDLIQSKFDEQQKEAAQNTLVPLNRVERKQILSKLIQLKQKLNDSIIKASSNSFDSKADKFAASRAIPSRRMNIIRSQKLLEKQDTVLLANQKLASEASKLLANVNDVPEIDGLDPCELSMMTSLDLAKDGDCLGLTLHVSRPDVTMVVPSLVQIHGIAPHVLSYSSFRDLVAAAPDSNDFNHVAALMKKDRYFSTSFNCVVPLFLNDTHWTVAKHYWPIACGWVVSLDERLGDWDIVGPVVCSFAFWFWSNGGPASMKTEKERLLCSLLWATLQKLAEEPRCAAYIENFLFNKREKGLLNKTEIPNLRALIGAMALCERQLGDDDIRLFSLELLRRKFGQRLDTQGAWTELMNLFSDAVEWESITQTSFWKENIGINSSVKPNLEFSERTCFVAWALRNCFNDKMDEWSCSHRSFLENTEEETIKIFKETRQRIAELERKEQIRIGNYSNALSWIQGEDSGFVLSDVGISHIYQNSFLSQALRSARGRRGYVKNGKAKYQFLNEQMNVPLSARNKNAFF